MLRGGRAGGGGGRKCGFFSSACWLHLIALSHGAIFLATCNAILLLGDLNL